MTNETLNESLRLYIAENPWIIILLIWIIIWKGLSLWQAAKRDQKIWFLALLVVNTLGILEIIYLLLVYWQDKNKPINPFAPKNFTPPENPNLP